MFVYLDGPITLMAPTDDAFNRLGNDTVAKLLQNPKLLGGKFTTQMPLSIADELSSSSSSFIQNHLKYDLTNCAKYIFMFDGFDKTFFTKMK